MQDNLIIISVNMNRQQTALMTMLETTDTSILLIQEPSWGRLVPKKSDTNPDGVEVRGTCSHPQWQTILPHTSEDEPIPHVAIFLCTDLTNSITYSILPDVNSYACLGIHLDTDTPLSIINYYHHFINKHPDFQHLFTLSIPDGAFMLCGDFNTHSPSWSPPNVSASPLAHNLETWLESTNLISIVPEGSITRRGSGKPSLLDHIFVNWGFLEHPFFPAMCSVSFERSISSDHAALLVDLPLATIPIKPPSQPCWTIEDQMEKEWKEAFAMFPHPLISNIPSLDRASEDLITLTHATCDKFFTRKHIHNGKGLAWWNDACRIAAAEVSRAHGPTRRHLSTVLQTTLQHAKQEWLERLITDPSTSIWDLAKWRNGRRSPWIPQINRSSDPDDMGRAFKERFFSFPKPPEPVLTLPGTPLPKRQFYDVTKHEVENTLKNTSNKSAPGPSGVGYKLVKWAFAAHPDFILDIYTSALCLGHHPWTTAKVVILPKPNKPDYSQAKAYRPVSLLECFGKVLEKIVANHFTSDSIFTAFSRIRNLVHDPTTQLQTRVPSYSTKQA